MVNGDPFLSVARRASQPDKDPMRVHTRLIELGMKPLDLQKAGIWLLVDRGGTKRIIE